MNVMIIAGYDVLANEISTHRNYVKCSFEKGVDESVDLIFTVGGATNPDYPKLTEAEANAMIIKEIKERFFGKTTILRNKKIREIPIVSLPTGNTSTDTLEAVKEYLERKAIFVDKLIICTEQSRFAGFMLDALIVGLLDLSRQIIGYGHSFPESKDNFSLQRKKMMLKTLSHRSKIFRFLGSIYQKIHQRRVARIKRKEK